MDLKIDNGGAEESSEEDPQEVYETNPLYSTKKNIHRSLAVIPEPKLKQTRESFGKRRKLSQFSYGNFQITSSKFLEVWIFLILIAEELGKLNQWSIENILARNRLGASYSPISKLDLPKMERKFLIPKSKRSEEIDLTDKKGSPREFYRRNRKVLKVNMNKI